MAKKPILTAEEPSSLISMDPLAAARSIDVLVSQNTDEFDFLSEKVMIQFYNLEQPGNSAHFVYGPANAPTRIDIDHGEQRELTRGEIRYIESRQTPIKEYERDSGDARGPKKKRKAIVVGWKSRFQCREIRAPKRKAV